MNRILVTGGAGYIGSAAVKSLIEKGYKVIVVDNLSKGLKRLVHKKAKFYKADLTNKKALEKAFETWLSPTNFSDEGQQKTALSQLTKHATLQNKNQAHQSLQPTI